MEIHSNAMAAVPGLAPGSSATVDNVLRGYAGRGVFQNYRAVAGKTGKAQFDFGWLYGQPFALTCDVSHHRLTLTELLPCVDPDSLMYRELKAFLKGLGHVDLPDHRRVDPLLAKLAPRMRAGVVSLELSLVGDDYEYGTRKLINAAHELFLFLNEHWADYMSRNFQLNME
ncbi:MAG: hypothetical protein JWQ01_548 [Massilia sp.]|nr:hypothetical protein [Massilia sp.]